MSERQLSDPDVGAAQFCSQLDDPRVCTLQNKASFRVIHEPKAFRGPFFLSGSSHPLFYFNTTWAGRATM